VRLDRIFGRNDGMVKLRGVNVFPEAVGAIVGGDPRANGEFVCIVERVGADDHDEMTVLVETAEGSTDVAALEKGLATRFRDSLGVKLLVKAVGKGETDPYTGLSSTSKIKRVLDRPQISVEVKHAALRLSFSLGHAQGLHLPHRTRNGPAGQGMGHDRRVSHRRRDGSLFQAEQCAGHPRSRLDEVPAIPEMREYHDYAFEVQRRHPDVIFGHWIILDPRKGQEAVKELERASPPGPGFVGLAISGQGVGVRRPIRCGIRSTRSPSTRACR
jgi:hypothetical protein